MRDVQCPITVQNLENCYKCYKIVLLIIHRGSLWNYTITNYNVKHVKLFTNNLISPKNLNL